MSVRKEIHDIVAQLESQGWFVDRTTKGKWLAWPPDGVTRAIPIHLTPSDHRWKKNLVAQLRRAGAVI